MLHGTKIKVTLTADHRISGDQEVSVQHTGKFIRMHPDGEWCDVELDEKHAGGVGKISVPRELVVRKGED